MTTLHAFLADVDATEQVGQALAATRPATAVVQLHGDLGAGKSTLARALLRALGVTGPIRSPTYTLVERYPLTAGGEAWHLDLYRIGHAGSWIFSDWTRAVPPCGWSNGRSAGLALCRRRIWRSNWQWPGTDAR